MNRDRPRTSTANESQVMVEIHTEPPLFRSSNGTNSRVGLRGAVCTDSQLVARRVSEREADSGSKHQPGQ